MKKILFFCVISMLVFASAAQAQSNYNRNVIRLSYHDGFPAVFTSVFLSAFIPADSDISTAGAFSASYGYRISDRFMVGALLGYQNLNVKYNIKGDSKKKVDSSLGIYTIMPKAELSYLDKRVVKLYGNVGAGLDVGSEGGVGFAFVVTPIAVRVGSDNVGFFVEAGLGTMQLGFSLGLDFRF